MTRTELRLDLEPTINRTHDQLSFIRMSLMARYQAAGNVIVPGELDHARHVMHARDSTNPDRADIDPVRWCSCPKDASGHNGRESGCKRSSNGAFEECASR
jgi:hypothetical protein